MSEASVNINGDPALVVAIGTSPSVSEGCVHKHEDINENIQYLLLSILCIIWRPKPKFLHWSQRFLLYPYLHSGQTNPCHMARPDQEEGSGLLYKTLLFCALSK